MATHNRPGYEDFVRRLAQAPVEDQRRALRLLLQILHRLRMEERRHIDEQARIDRTAAQLLADVDLGQAWGDD